MIGCICGCILEGLILLGAIGLSAISYPVAHVYNSWCKKRHKHKCERHSNQVICDSLGS